jgi:polyisoprenoid-binding protein YceI
MNFNRVRAFKTSSHYIRWIVPLILVVAGLGATAATQEVALQVDSSKSTVKFTLGDVLHTVRGTFKVARGTLRFEPTSGKISGEIVVDAKSGESGSGMRDRRCTRKFWRATAIRRLRFGR